MTQDNSLEATPKKRRLTTYNIVMLILTAAVILVGLGLIVGEQFARRAAFGFYNTLDARIAENTPIQRADVQATASNDYGAADPASSASGVQLKDVFTWNGLIYRYHVEVIYNRAERTAEKVSLESEYRFGGGD